jgi:hypothetical protein
MVDLIYYPKIDLDYDYLKQLVYSSTPIEGRPNHHRLVEDDEYMTMLRNKYSFLSPIYNVYRMKGGLPLHVDAARQCTLNIPLVNTEYSTTIVYEPVSSDTLHDAKTVIHIITDRTNLVETLRFSLDRPTLFNTTVPHEVVQRDSEERISISWSISSEFSFEQAMKLFSECEQD